VICLEQNPSTGALQVIDPQPSDITSCTLVVGNYSESGAGVSELFQLSPAQGAEIGGAIMLVWALVWGIRMVVRSLNVSEGNENENS
jgi:hypothetical protein